MAGRGGYDVGVSLEGSLGNVYRGARVLVTGHTGFKGSWLGLWLERLGAEVVGLSLPAEPDSLYIRADLKGRWDESFADIRDRESLNSLFRRECIDLVLHLAAQPLVFTGYEEPLSTFEINTMGTANVLEAMRTHSMAKGAVVITTDKVYRPSSERYAYREGDPLGGNDPYAASKAAAEHVVCAWRTLCQLNGTQRILVARAGNVIGGGDYARNRLLPDLVRAFQAEEAATIRHPTHTRPWQHVLDPLLGYLMMGARLLTGEPVPDAMNFGPESEEFVGVVADFAVEAWGATARWEEVPLSRVPETPLLSLDSQLAQEFGWSPVWNTHQSISRTIEWWKSYYEGDSALALCLSDIEAFLHDLNLREGVGKS